MDKRPKIYGKFKDGAVVELADIKESGKGFNDYPPFYMVLAAINREEGYTYIVNPETGEILFDLVHDLITQNIRAIKLIAKKLNAVLR